MKLGQKAQFRRNMTFEAVITDKKMGCSIMRITRTKILRWTLEGKDEIPDSGPAIP